MRVAAPHEPAASVLGATGGGVAPPARGLAFGPAVGWLLSCLIVLATGAYLFGDGMAFIVTQWSDAEYSHGWLIPAITLFVLWSRRHVIMAARDQGSWAGTAVTALALLLLLLSAMAFVMRGPFVALIGLFLGLALAGLGWRAMRYAALPILFLVFAFPLPGSLAVPLSTTFQLISSELGTAMLRLLGISVFLDGNIIDLGVYKLQVAEACSGLRYLFPLASFGFICAWIYNAPLWARAVVLVSTVPITIVTNSARIALTGIFVEYGSIELAEGFMHLFEGWVIFLVALALLFFEMWLIARLVGRGRSLLDLLDFDRLAGTPAGDQPAGTSAGDRPAVAPAGGPAALPSGFAATSSTAPAGVTLPFIASAGLMLATALAFAPLTDRQQYIPDRPGLATYPLQLDPWRGRAMAIEDASVLSFLGATDYFLADFTTRGSSTPVNLWVAYYDHQLGTAAIHSPKDCLPGGGWEYVQLETVAAPVTTASGQAFQLNRGVIAKGLDQMVIYYWLDMRGRQITDDTMLKLYNLWDSYSLGRSDGALVRFMTPVAPGESVDAADGRLRDFLTRAYPLLEPHVGA